MTAQGCPEAEVWPLVLPRLPLLSLAALACVCRSFQRKVAELRARDVACGREPFLVLAPTTEDAAALASVLKYSAECVQSVDEATCDESANRSGCACGDLCGPGCTCVASLLECGRLCSCRSACSNRATRQRLCFPLHLRRDAARGWCICAGACIPRNAFVCIYAGELVDDIQMARRRLAQQDALETANYIFCAREHFGSRTVATVIDPTSVGNAGRFLNHACDGGNLAVRIARALGDDSPRVGFFAARNIALDEELCYSYGQPTSAGRRKCHCGTAACKGTLPSDEM
jgi:SET domain